MACRDTAMTIEKGHTMKISQCVIRSLCLLGLWLGLGLQVHAQTDTVTYIYTDPQGTPLVKADASGNVIARYDYTPYGNSVTSLSAAPNGPGYTGHVNDPETGWVYMQARYYQPDGRFLSPDPMAPMPGNIFGFNRYAYADDNPVMRTDPDGRESACVNQANHCSGSNPNAEAFVRSVGNVSSGVLKAVVNEAQKLDNLQQGPSDLEPATASNNDQAIGMVIGSVLVGATEAVATDGESAATGQAASAAEKVSTLKLGPFAGESIPARSASQNFNSSERASINGIGSNTGCHTCGSTAPGTKSGNFVPDHQPVSSLNSTNAPQRLYPQCLSCSKQQGLDAAREIRNQ
jgi:RHS repeat-associated protein